MCRSWRTWCWCWNTWALLSLFCCCVTTHSEHTLLPLTTNFSTTARMKVVRRWRRKRKKLTNNTVSKRLLLMLLQLWYTNRYARPEATENPSMNIGLWVMHIQKLGIAMCDGKVSRETKNYSHFHEKLFLLPFCSGESVGVPGGETAATFSSTVPVLLTPDRRYWRFPFFLRKNDYYFDFPLESRGNNRSHVEFSVKYLIVITVVHVL